MEALTKRGPKFGKRDAEQLWKEFEDYLAPLLGLRAGERAMYSYLLRHSWLEGRRGLVVSVPALGRASGMSYHTARLTLLKLTRKGCVTLQPYRSKYAIQVLLPEEVLSAIRPRDFASMNLRIRRVSKDRMVREALLLRERGRCFYCLRRLVAGHVWFDHIVPLASGGAAHEGNLVACCQPCNRRKMILSARAYLRKLVREGTITKEQMKRQLALAKEYLSGKAGLKKAA